MNVEVCSIGVGERVSTYVDHGGKFWVNCDTGHKCDVAAAWIVAAWLVVVVVADVDDGVLAIDAFVVHVNEGVEEVSYGAVFVVGVELVVNAYDADDDDDRM